MEIKDLIMVILILQIIIIAGFTLILDEIKGIKESLKVYFQQIDYHNLQILLKKRECSNCKPPNKSE